MSAAAPRITTFDDLLQRADAEGATLYLEQGEIRLQSDSRPSAELTRGLIDHRAELAAVLALMPGERREPGADEPAWTDLSESLLGELPGSLADHERAQWCADLGRLWSRGASGRRAAREAHLELARRCEAHRAAQRPAPADEPDSDLFPAAASAPADRASLERRSEAAA